MVKILEQLRNIAFWSLDAVKGGGIKAHCKEIELILQHPDSRKAKQLREGYLKDLLDHAVQTVPFYNQLQGVSIKLQDFPIIDKQTVRENFDGFRSQRYLTAHNHQVTTSGSTGKPFKILQNKDKRMRNTADTYYFASKAGFKLGSRLYYLRLWDKQYKKNPLLTKIQNIAAYSVDDLTEENLAKLVAELENNPSRKSMLAYTSALNTVIHYAEYTLGRPLKVQFDSVIAIAEALGADTKVKAKKYLGAEVLSRYSNSENGIIAQQRANDGSPRFEINWASYHVELLDLNHDKPANPGETGRIVITDFFNHAMPMIRYDTGDVGVMEYDDQLKAMVFTKIEGRKMDMFINTKGEFISSHLIHHILQFNGIDQFQFVVEADGQYTIKLKVSADYDRNDEGRIRKIYLDYFGEDAIIHVNYVDDIPLLSSGKRKLVVNNADVDQIKEKRKRMVAENEPQKEQINV